MKILLLLGIFVAACSAQITSPVIRSIMGLRAEVGFAKAACAAANINAACSETCILGQLGILEEGNFINVDAFLAFAAPLLEDDPVVIEAYVNAIGTCNNDIDGCQFASNFLKCIFSTQATSQLQPFF